MSFNGPRIEREGGTGETQDTDDEFEAGANTRDVFAKVGDLEFKPRYANPAVNVRQEQRTAEHELVAGSNSNEDFVVQALTKKPPKITINGRVVESQLDTVDELVELDIVQVRTDRWTGEAVPINASTSDPKLTDKELDERLHDVTITLTGVSRSYRSE